jgi:CheY-like chemotaxis protein
MRIVVADNDRDALDLAVLDLSLEGHDIVAVAADGDEAILQCHTHRPDALVVDFRMPPGPDGLEVARRVTAELPGTRVVVFSNYSLARVVRAARARGVTFLSKGDLRALRRALR